MEIKKTRPTLYSTFKADIIKVGSVFSISNFFVHKSGKQLECKKNIFLHEFGFNSRHSNFKSFSWSPEHFFLTVGQNNFGNKIPFLFSWKEKTYYSSFAQILNKVHTYIYYGCPAWIFRFFFLPFLPKTAHLIIAFLNILLRSKCIMYAKPTQI